MTSIKQILSGVLLSSFLLFADEPTTGIQLGDTLIPTGSFPSHIANKGYGGYHTVTNLNDIPEYLLTSGTAAWNLTDSNLYIWDGATWNVFAQIDETVFTNVMFTSDYVQNDVGNNNIVDHALFADLAGSTEYSDNADMADYANSSGYASDADKLDGHDSTYFAEASVVNNIIIDVNSNTIDIASLMDEVYYVEPIVTWASGGGTYEHGYVIDNINLDFTCNKPMESRIYSLGYAEDLGSGQNNTFTDTTDVTATKSFRITVEDVRGNTDISTKTFTFTNRKYTGASNKEFTSMSNSDILSLTTEWETKGDSGEYYLTTEYIYICYPSSRGTCSSFSIGGFGSDTWPLDVRNVTNSNGYVEMYNIYHSINKTSGNTLYDIH